MPLPCWGLHPNAGNHLYIFQHCAENRHIVVIKRGQNYNIGLFKGNDYFIFFKTLIWNQSQK